LAVGNIQYGIQAAEEKSRRFKRSIYVAKPIKAGEVFNAENLRVIRPGDGLAPKYYERLLGKTARYDLKEGTPLSFDHLL